MPGILAQSDFATLMQKHIYECLDFALKKGADFSVVANLARVKFDPELPSEVAPKSSTVLFSLGGYTLESASLSRETLSFEAGFGAQDFASFVQIPLSAIFQIIVDQSVMCVNFSTYDEKEALSKTEQSKQKFMSNPKNKAIFNKE